MRGQHAGNGEALAVSEEVHFHQQQALGASLYWTVHLAPPAITTEDNRTLHGLMLSMSVDDSVDGFDGKRDGFNPRNNPILGLLLSLMAFEGALPLEPNGELPEQRERKHRDRIPSVELAELLGISTRDLAEMMRWANVYTRDIRFSHGVTRGYKLEDVEAGWDRMFGNFQRELVAAELEALEKRRGGRRASAAKRQEMRDYLNGQWSHRDGWGYRGRTRALTEA